MRIVVVLLLLLLSHSAVATVTITEAFTVKHQATISYSVNRHQTLNALLKQPIDWQQEPDLPVGLKPGDKYLWLKISFDNTQHHQVPLLVTIANNLIDSVTAYHVQPNSAILTLGMGDALPLMKRPIKYESLVVPLQLKGQSRSELYLQIAHHGVVNAPISIWSPNAYLKYKSKFNLLFGLLAGFLAALALTLFALYFVTQKRYFLYGTAFLTLVWLCNIHLYGFGYRFFYPDWQWFQQHGQGLLSLSATLLLFPILNYCSVQKLKQRPTPTFKWVLTLACLLVLALTFFSITSALLAALTIAFIISLFCLYLLAKSQQPSRKTMLAVVIGHSIVISYQLTVAVGVQSGSFLNQLGFFSLFVAESVVVAFLIIQLYIKERDSKLAKQQQRLAHTQAEDALLKEKLKLQEQAQLDLESNIEERTFELQVTLRELQEKNRELERVNMEDPLTKVKNRRYFDKRLQMEVRRSRREQSVLSLVILDIDHFKKINDNYGHLVGDQAICEFANLINRFLRRPQDEVFRYGGEEFILLLPNTDSDGAVEVAERVRAATQEMVIKVGEHELNFTTSAGVYSAVVTDPHSPQLYTDNADKALYQAKAQGRNRVVTYQSKQEN